MSRENPPLWAKLVVFLISTWLFIIALYLAIGITRVAYAIANGSVTC